MSKGKVVEFVPLLNFENEYEILNIFPFTIRRKKDHYEFKESILNTGYIRVKLNRYDYKKHVLIAKQFLPNPLNLAEVDHINHDRTGYRLENLRWFSHLENMKNKTSNCVTDYGKHQFEEYYYNETNNRFYFWNGI